MNPIKHIPFALPLIGEAEIQEVVDCMRSGWITTGPRTRLFERDFETFVGNKYALAVNSATAGLHLALEAIGVTHGDKVITTPYTFTATAEVIRYLGAEPIFIDVEPDNFNISTSGLRDYKGNWDKVKAILPVHFAGKACEMDTISQIAKDSRSHVVEDAAHALPTTYKGKTIGSFGDIAVFSFYATKTITTGEGGMIVTANDEWAERMRTMRLHGINRDVFDRYSSKKPSWYYEVVAPGFKYNMPDLAAAIGIHQLKRANEFQRRREIIADKYSEAFKNLPLKLPNKLPTKDIHSWHLYVILLDLDELTISRNNFIERMATEGVGTSVHFIPLHLQPYWRDRYQYLPEDFPVALSLYERSVSLPIYPKMTDDDVEIVINAVKSIIGNTVK